MILPLDLQFDFLYNIDINDVQRVSRSQPQTQLFVYSSREGSSVEIIKVSGKSRTAAVAGAIAGVIRENQHAEVQAIGASAINQAVKAMALAKNYLVEDGYNIVIVPEFVDVEIDDKIRTAIRFTVEPR